MLSDISIRYVTAEDLRSPVLSALLQGASLSKIAELDRDGSETLSIVRDQTIVGMACLKADGEIMAMVAAAYTRQGIATQACKLVLHRAFEARPLTRIWARARIDTAGERLARRLGLREYHRENDEVFLELGHPEWAVLTDAPATPTASSQP